MTEAKRVALLARPGPACEKLQSALHQAGADLVHVADPTAGDADGLAAVEPDAVLVALEPEVEAALDGFDAILQDARRTVIYDEAELAASREGWDEARWVRHLAAKLGGHSDVLPPGREMEADPDPEPEPALEPEAALEPDFAWQPAALDETGSGPEFDTGFEAGPEPDATRAVTIEYGGGSVFGALSLEPADDAVETAAVAGREMQAPTIDPVPPGGAVVHAGIGGPDAVRQFLAALPEDLQRPVLVRQRLDGGRHDRLVRQLQRATALPVELAEAGMQLAPGHVYILPEGIAAESSGDGSRFVEAAGQVDALAGLPPAGSAVVLLSGADPARVEEVMGLAEAGTLVAGQAPEECFDNAGPGAAIGRGAESGSPSQLAERVAGLWNP